MVDALPLVVVVVLQVDGSMDNWLHHVNSEEHGDGGPQEARIVARKTHVDDAISKGATHWVPQTSVGWSAAERYFALAEALDVHINVRL